MLLALWLLKKITSCIKEEVISFGGFFKEEETPFGKGYDLQIFFAPSRQMREFFQYCCFHSSVNVSSLNVFCFPDVIWLGVSFVIWCLYSFDGATSFNLAFISWRSKLVTSRRLNSPASWIIMPFQVRTPTGFPKALISMEHSHVEKLHTKNDPYHTPVCA